MASDPKGLVFNGAGSGLATILDSGETERTRQRLSVEQQRKVQEEVLAKDKKNKQLEGLKPEAVWRYYQPALQKEYQSIVDDLKNEKIDPFELKQRVAAYAGRAQTTIQLQDEYKNAAQDFEKNKKVLGGANDWYLNSFHGDPSISNLEKISSSPLNRYGFLDEKGGSKYVNTTEAFNDVIEKGLAGWVENETAKAIGSGKTVARGLMQFQTQNDLSKLKSFTQVDPKTGQIYVKDADQLIDSGVLDLFEQDGYANRVLEDRTDEIIGTSEVSPEDRQRVKTQVLRQMLQPYGAQGQYKSESKKDFRSFSVPQPTGGGNGSDDKDKAQRIYDVFSSRSVGKGQDVGETKKYTKKMLMDRGYSEEKADQLVKKGATYMESKALKGWKNEAGEVLGNIYWSEYNDKDFPQRIAKIDVYKPGSDEPEKRTLSLNELQSFIPISVYKEVEQIARDKGRLNASGNFIYRPNSNYNQKLKK